MWNLALDGNGDPLLPNSNSCSEGCRGMVTINSDGTYSVNQECTLCHSFAQGHDTEATPSLLGSTSSQRHYSQGRRRTVRAEHWLIRKWRHGMGPGGQCIRDRPCEPVGLAALQSRRLELVCCLGRMLGRPRLTAAAGPTTRTARGTHSRSRLRSSSAASKRRTPSLSA